MSDCDHITHPEHWSGDAGDVITALQPFAFIAAAAQNIVAVMGDNLGINFNGINLGTIHPAWRR